MEKIPKFIRWNRQIDLNNFVAFLITNYLDNGAYSMSEWDSEWKWLDHFENKMYISS